MKKSFHLTFLKLVQNREKLWVTAGNWTAHAKEEQQRGKVTSLLTRPLKG